MCGIVGVFSSEWTPFLKNRLNYGLEGLRDRGPDDSGLEIFHSSHGVIGLGHTRLSIIDISDGGHQPMMDDEKRFTIVFNGEIYNYTELRTELISEGLIFNSDSDTEVLLKAWVFWGEACLSRLVGMFAFVVYDSLLDTLTLARDAFGIKPLFYSVSNNRISFGSEIKAVTPLMNEEPRMDQETVYSYLIHGVYDNSKSTFFDGVCQLQPGHIGRINLASPAVIDLEHWWNPSVDLNSKLSFNAAAAELRRLFLDSIKLHLRSDVPLCVNLSGGIDSSAIACAVRYVYPDIPISTVSYVARGSAEDEEKWIDIVNAKIDATSHKFALNGENFIRDIDDVIMAQGEPFVSTSVYASYKVFKHIRSLGFVVSLDGQGADEMLAGYDGYPHGLVDSMVTKKNIFGVMKFIIAWLKWPGRSKLGLLKALFKNTNNQIIWNLLYFLGGRKLKPRWLKRECVPKRDKMWTYNDELFLEQREVHGRTLVGLLRSALTKHGLPGLLRHGDRNAMVSSVESRVPFLTPQVAEFCLGLPEDYLLSNGGETKSIFRAAMRGIVPDEILDRKDKIGFKTPEHSWLIGEQDTVRSWLDYCKEISMINSTEFIREIEMVFSGAAPYSAQTWRMINFCRWAMLHNLK